MEQRELAQELDTLIKAGVDQQHCQAQQRPNSQALRCRQLHPQSAMQLWHSQCHQTLQTMLEYDSAQWLEVIQSIINSNQSAFEKRKHIECFVLSCHHRVECLEPSPLNLNADKPE